MSIIELWHVARHYSAVRILRRVWLLGKRAGGKRLALKLPAHDRRFEPVGEVGLAAKLPLPCSDSSCFELIRESGTLAVELHGERVGLTENIDWAGKSEPLASSHLRRYHLHYMEYLAGVDDAEFERLTTDWMTSNRPFLGPGSDAFASYCIAIRVVVWLEQIERRRATLDAGLVNRLARSLVEQVNYLAAFLERDIGGNHLFKNLRALLWASVCIRCEDSDRWQRVGLHHLRKELASQYLPDGFHFERSPAYHAQVMSDFADILVLDIAQVNESDAPAVYERAERAYLDLLQPDGCATRLSDGLFGACEVKPPVATDATSLPSNRGVHYPDAGFVVWRNANTFVAYDVGDMGPHDLPGHAHADVFTFEWTVDGQRIVVDPGVYAYESGPERAYSRSTVAHNTVCVGDADQALLYGSFRVGRTPRVTVANLNVSSAGMDVSASHDGYEKRFGVLHERRFEANAEGLRITDELRGKPVEAASGALLLHPDCEITRTSDLSCTIRRGEVHVVVQSNTPLSYSSVDYFSCMGHREQATQLRYALDDKPAVVTLVPGREGDA